MYSRSSCSYVCIINIFIFVQLKFKVLVDSLSVLRKVLQIFLVFLHVSFLVMISYLVGYNLYMVTFIGDVFKTVVSIYAQDKLSPLPSLEEILICNERTTVEEVFLFSA